MPLTVKMEVNPKETLDQEDVATDLRVSLGHHIPGRASVSEPDGLMALSHGMEIAPSINDRRTTYFYVHNGAASYLPKTSDSEIC